MNAAARVDGSDVVAGRGDLIREGRGREGGDDRREAVEFPSSGSAWIPPIQAGQALPCRSRSVTGMGTRPWHGARN